MPGEFDFDSAVSQIGADLGYSSEPATEFVERVEGDEGSEGGDSTHQPAAPASMTPATPEPPPALKPPDPHKEPPKTWQKDATAGWEQLPPHIRAQIYKREQDIFSGLETYKTDAGFGKSVQKAIEPFRGVMEQHGIDPVAQLGQLAQAHYTLATGTPEQKQQLFSQLAQTYGVTLQDPADAPYVDPAVQALQTELQSVKSQLTQFTRSAQETTQQRFQQEVEQFAKDPANPHFDLVANDIAALIKSGVAKDLKEAYEKAVWAHPTARQLELTRQQTEAAKKAAEEATAKAAQVQRTTSANVRTSAKGGGAAAHTGSIDDTLKETLANIKSRG